VAANDGDTVPVHVNFHGGGYVMPLTETDDPGCRYLVAPKHHFPDAPHQAYEVGEWVAEHAAQYGWDAHRLTVGG